MIIKNLFSSLGFVRRLSLFGLMAILLIGLLPAQAALAAITFLDSYQVGPTGNAKNSTITLAVPAATLEGDFLLATFSFKGGGEYALSSPNPNGWTRIDGASVDHDPNLEVYYKIATASDELGPSYNWDIYDNKDASKAKEYVGAISTYTGVDTSNPIVDAAGLSGKSKNITAPDATRGTADTMVVRVFAQKDIHQASAPLFTYPDDYDATTVDFERLEVHFFNNDPQAKVSMAVGDKTDSSTANTGTSQLTTVRDQEWAAATVVLKPGIIPELTIDKDTVSAPVSVAAGGTFQYQIVVTNASTSPLDATGLSVDDTLPTGFTHFSTDSTTLTDLGAGNCATGAVVPSNANPGAGVAAPTWGDFTLPIDCSLTITFTVTVAGNVAAGTYDNTASTSGSNFTTIDDDGTAAQDSDTPTGADPENDEDVTVLNAKLEIDKDRAAGQSLSVLAGGQVSYTISVTNTGDVTATGVTIGDVLPSGFTYASTDSIVLAGSSTGPTNANPTVGDATPDWDDFTIPASGEVTITFTADTPAVVGTYDNTATTSATNVTQVDDEGGTAQDADTPSGQDPEDDEDIQLTAGDLVVTKSVINDNVYRNEGDTIAYLIKVENISNDAATNVVVTDILPPVPFGVEHVGDIASTGSYDDGTGVWNIGGIAANDEETLIVFAYITPGQLTNPVLDDDNEGAVITNSASAVQDQAQDNRDNDTDSVDITICRQADVHNLVSVTSTETDADTSDNSFHLCTSMTPAIDTGDAPASFGDSSHIVNTDLFLGSNAPDDELLASNYSTGADGDGADEDGVVFRSPAQSNQSIFADVTVTNNTDVPAIVCGWLDDPVLVTIGVFNTGEGRCDVAPRNATTLVTFQWEGLPNDKEYTTYTRFRVVSLGSALAEAFAEGPSLPEGEVEDYRLDFDFRPTAVTIGSVSLESSSVADFLAMLGASKMSASELLALLAATDPEAAASLQGASISDILAALMAALDPDGDGQVALLLWDTLEERGTIGFYVDRQGPDGHWSRVNNNMLPGMITAPMGAEYMLVDPGAVSGNVYQYRLIELEATGKTNEYGPFTLEME